MSVHDAIQNAQVAHLGSQTTPTLCQKCGKRPGTERFATDGKRRHFFYQVEPEDHDANQDRHAWAARRWDA